MLGGGGRWGGDEVGRQHQGMDSFGVRQVQRTVENREKWRKLVVKSSVVPQQLSGIDDDDDDDVSKILSYEYYERHFKWVTSSETH